MHIFYSQTKFVQDVNFKFFAVSAIDTQHLWFVVQFWRYIICMYVCMYFALAYCITNCKCCEPNYNISSFF